MAQPYLGDIRMFAGNFPPDGYAFCDGSLLNIATNASLFQLLGTTYGGDGITTFALPDLRSRIPIHRGAGPALTPRLLGQSGGTEKVTLTQGQMAAHTHVLSGSEAPATDLGPRSNNGLAESQGRIYAQPSPTPVNMAPSSVSTVGNGTPHDNMQPFLCVNFIIAVRGFFPTPS